MNRIGYRSYFETEKSLNGDFSSVKLSNDCLKYVTTIEALNKVGEDCIPYSFTLCCKMGLVDVVEEMLKMGADPTVDNFNAFKFASEQGHNKVLSLLLDNIDPRDFRIQLNQCKILSIKYNRKHCISLLESI